MAENIIQPNLKHEQLTSIIRASVISGELRAGECLPSQKEMCERYSLSTSTVREAIGSLVHEGLLVRIQGKGTFVAESNAEQIVIGIAMADLGKSDPSQFGPGPDLTAAYIHYIQEEAIENDCRVDLRLHSSNHDGERKALSALVESKVSGIITVYVGADANIDCLQNIRTSGIPLVLIDHYRPDVDADYVVTDNYTGAYRVTCSLIDAGYSNVVHFTHPNRVSSVRERIGGYEAAMNVCGMSPSVLSVPGCDSINEQEVHDAAYRAAKELLMKSRGRTAIFTANAVMLPGVWRAGCELGFDSEDLALACFDQPSESIPDDIAHVFAIQPTEQIARSSVRVLLDGLRGNSISNRLMLAPHIESANLFSRSKQPV